jgi:hypothetical protein
LSCLEFRSVLFRYLNGRQTCSNLSHKFRVVVSDSMEFQKLSKLFLIRKFAVLLGLFGYVGGDSLYVRLAH